MSEFEVNGVTYRAGKMDAFKQFHVGRRLAPVLVGVVGLLASVNTPPVDPAPDGAAVEPQTAQGGDSAVEPTAEPVDAAAALGPLTEAMAQMSDEHANYILKECLAVVSRRLDAGTGWAPVMVRSTGLLLGEMDMATMLQLVFHVVRDNLSGFFSALPPMSPQALAGVFKDSRS